jgi:excisionase family DNA binding protein
MEQDGRLTYSVEEAAKLLGIGRNQAYEAARTGKLPSIRIGKRILVPRAALDRLLTKAAA